MTAEQSKKSTTRDVDQSQQQNLRELERQERIKENKLASAPVIEELAKAGFKIEWISDLYSHRLNYKSAIPILLHWLPRIDNTDVKEAIVRALSVPWAKPVAAPILIEEFRKEISRKLEASDFTGFLWTIGNALAVVADDSVFTDIANLALDIKLGKAREMLVLALGNMKNPRAREILIDLLEDDEMVGYAIMALGKLRAKEAYTEIKKYQTHPKTWVRKEAKKALARIEKAHS